MVWFMEGICVLPVFLVIWSSSTFLISYIVALLRGDVDVIFPYISDTGTNPPESGIFGLMTTIGAFAGLATIFARYKYVEKICEATTRSRLNRIAFCFGITSCLGMCFIATFQETQNPLVHDIAALTVFLSGETYIILQSIISRRMYPYWSSRTVCLSQTFISAISVFASVTMIVCGVLVKSSKLHWKIHNEQYILHVVSAVSEWIVSFAFVFFFFTYIREFKKVTLKLKVSVHY
ncbi:DNA damage-regulated autophagy modulator protein 1 [Brienomyrus brachyistius]|uniref:DNA damage-regulated autophagy modulator protein 1 n=1 Tax=Brienomyrus brachyistius TaxID=42636 RepID=UPI0020B2C721|nr:DNA damage-regulated autophagy modulator protein 1 [Brienomyrus brachyistius]